MCRIISRASSAYLMAPIASQAGMPLQAWARLWVKISPFSLKKLCSSSLIRSESQPNRSIKSKWLGIYSSRAPLWNLRERLCTSRRANPLKFLRNRLAIAKTKHRILTLTLISPLRASRSSLRFQVKSYQTPHSANKSWKTVITRPCASQKLQSSQKCSYSMAIWWTRILNFCLTQKKQSE